MVPHADDARQRAEGQVYGRAPGAVKTSRTPPTRAQRLREPFFLTGHVHGLGRVPVDGRRLDVGPVAVGVAGPAAASGGVPSDGGHRRGAGASPTPAGGPARVGGPPAAPRRGRAGDGSAGAARLHRRPAGVSAAVSAGGSSAARRRPASAGVSAPAPATGGSSRAAGCVGGLLRRRRRRSAGAPARAPARLVDRRSSDGLRRLLGSLVAACSSAGLCSWLGHRGDVLRRRRRGLAVRPSPAGAVAGVRRRAAAAAARDGCGAAPRPAASSGSTGSCVDEQAAALAVLAGLAERLEQAGADPLAGHLHQARARSPRRPGGGCGRGRGTRPAGAARGRGCSRAPCR